MVHEFKRDLLLGTLLVQCPEYSFTGLAVYFMGNPAKLPSKGNKQSEAIKTYSTACSILEPDFSSEAEVGKVHERSYFSQRQAPTYELGNYTILVRLGSVILLMCTKRNSQTKFCDMALNLASCVPLGSKHEGR